MQSKRNNITRQNHYLPQRYQLGFAVGEEIWVYDRQANSYRQGHPKTIGVLNDFYTTQEPNGERCDEVEGVLAKLESSVWPIIDRLDARIQNWETDDRPNLALFAAFMRTRVPAFDIEQSKFANDFTRWWVKAKHPTAQAIVDSVFEATGKTLSLDQAEEIHRGVHDDDYEVENPRQNNIKMMLDLALELAGMILRMDWTVLWSPVETAYITSDNPYVQFPPRGFDSTLSGVGLLTPGATTIIPLTARTALCLGNDGISGTVRYDHASSGFVRSVNLRVAANSDRFILARDEAHLRGLVRKTKADQWRNEFRLNMNVPNSSEVGPGVPMPDVTDR